MGASLALAALPLIAEMAKLGSVGIVPAEVALVTAAMLSIAASALRSARRSRIYDAATGLPNRRALDEILSDQAGCRSEEHTSELQSLMRISSAVFCLKKKT